MISIDDPHLDEAVREAHPEVVLAMLGRGVDQSSASDVQPGQQRTRDTITIIITIVTGEGSSVPRPRLFGTRQGADYLVTAAETSDTCKHENTLLRSWNLTYFSYIE